MRTSEKQLMATGMLMMMASIAFSYATPINRLHKVRADLRPHLGAAPGATAQRHLALPERGYAVAHIAVPIACSRRSHRVV